MRGAPPGRIDQPNPSSPDIQVSRYESFCRKILGIKRAAILNRVDPAISINLDPDTRPEYQYAMGNRLINAWFGQAGVAAQFNNIGVYNPVGSNVLVIVEKAVCMTDLADGTAFNVAPVQLALMPDVAQVVSADLRYGSDPLGGNFSARLCAVNTGAVIVNQQGVRGRQTSAPVGSEMETLGPVVLPPGMMLYARSGGALKTLTFSFYGQERTLERSEK